MARVFVGVAVAVPDEAGFPVVVQEGVADCDVGAGVRDVEEAVVVVLWLGMRLIGGRLDGRDMWYLVVVHVAGQIAVVDPDVYCLRSLNADCVACVRDNVADREVADDYVGFLDQESDALEDYPRPISGHHQTQREVVTYRHWNPSR